MFQSVTRPRKSSTRKKQISVLVYDKKTAMMRKMGEPTKSSYCASPVVVEEGFRILCTAERNMSVCRTVVRKIIQDNKILLFVE
jgi:hypothetical protein